MMLLHAKETRLPTNQQKISQRQGTDSSSCHQKELCRHFDLWLLDFRLWANKFLLFKPHGMQCFVMEAQRTWHCGLPQILRYLSVWSWPSLVNSSHLNGRKKIKDYFSTAWEMTWADMCGTFYSRFLEEEMGRVRLYEVKWLLLWNIHWVPLIGVKLPGARLKDASEMQQECS